jgi:enoyl-[acyl-carrier-protein] reductase (NADH)
MEQKTPRETLMADAGTGMADAKSGLMAGKRGLIMGVANDHSIAWGIAQVLAGQGAELAFTYQGDAQAKRLKPLAASLGATIILPGDVEKDEDLDAVFASIKNEWAVWISWFTPLPFPTARN